MSTRPRVLTLSCPDRPGIVHAVTGALVALDANITESQQYGDPDTGLFCMRVAFDATASEEALRANLEVVAHRFDLDWKLSAADEPVPTLVMCSKQGHCLNDLLFRHRSGHLPVDIRAVVSNHTDLQPLAQFYGIPFVHVPVVTGDAASKAAGEARLLELVAEHGAELVVLARYMQVLSDDLCRSLSGRAINIHHSFLPSFKGARPYHQAHARGVKIIGATAHYVTADLDEGPIIEQEIERVDHRATASELVRLGQDVEARTLARAVRWHAEQRVLLDGNRTVVFR
ncbi:formyltetrahydrofolate deformylase [Kineococcus rhizosphaerae]|uniref:Formyltetrahydrofolate deformylase n=1 Tax=Kineococcus rhizosphaerae TaxID=559628 RepID=A0A2T0R1J4_9ACTN|nr:formyltetrahydrofolate deformylase [Kineococcus rhizosphaerae]PRY13422.1 formyltetrahydrofolate deformylase [Kineococcus rhizosphaerae]